MEKLDIILWVLSGGFTITFGLLVIMNKKIEKLDEKLTDVDRRLCRLEGAFASKDCCMIKDSRLRDKAE